MANRSRIEKYPSLIKGIAARVGNGSYPVAAARKYGVPQRTFNDWLATAAGIMEEYGVSDEEGLSPLSLTKHEVACVRLALAIEEALGTAEVGASEVLYQRDPKAWLQMGPIRERWQRESKVELEGYVEHGGEIEVQCPASRETLAAGLAELAAIGLIGDGDGKVFRQIQGPTPDNGNGEVE